MTRDEELELLALHLAGEPYEEWGAMLATGKLRTHKPTAADITRWYMDGLTVDETVFSGRYTRIRVFKSPSEVKIGQPVLLKIRPHGEWCGCDPLYSAHP